jgi:lipopolysaccharide/colanic/teichoic acid biosynthesis glycosyltransferase
MVKNADAIKEKLMKENERQDGPLFKMENDPRITKIGKFIRKFDIDELPQLWNVFIGNMSLI